MSRQLIRTFQFKRIYVIIIYYNCSFSRSLYLSIPLDLVWVLDDTDDEFGEKTVSVLLDGEESEIVFIDHPSSEMSVSFLHIPFHSFHFTSFFLFLFLLLYSCLIFFLRRYNNHCVCWVSKFETFCMTNELYTQMMQTKSIQSVKT